MTPPAWLPKAAPWITLVARLVLAGVFGYSGIHKILNPVDSVVAVEAYRIVPEQLVDYVGYGQPFLELAVAALLLAGFATRLVGVGTALLLLIFIAAVVSAWARGLTIDCGCFSGGGQVSEGETHYLRVILRDVGLIVLAVWAIIFPPGKFAVDSALGGNRGGEADGLAGEASA